MSTERIQPFDRPVFIVAAPRSCSTLLFQALARSEALCSLGDESHHVFEGHRKLSPGRGAVDSNRLTADLLDSALARSITERFAAGLRDRAGRTPPAGLRVRLLEKTPKNALRIPFIDALFPDALFVYLFRDPRENLASIIEAWRSGRFVTYTRIRTAHGPWSLLLPPGWAGYTERPLEEIAAFQWSAANRCILDDLARLPRQRWTSINASELLADPLAAVTRLCAFAGIEPDAGLLDSLARPLPLSRYTLSRPAAEKWRSHEAAIARVWADVVPLLPEINRFVEGSARPLPPLDPPDPRAPAPVPSVPPRREPPALAAPASRNSPCPCGSGRRYKSCHGSAAA